MKGALWIGGKMARIRKWRFFKEQDWDQSPAQQCEKKHRVKLDSRLMSIEHVDARWRRKQVNLCTASYCWNLFIFIYLFFCALLGQNLCTAGQHRMNNKHVTDRLTSFLSLASLPSVFGTTSSQSSISEIGREYAVRRGTLVLELFGAH